VSNKSIVAQNATGTMKMNQKFGQLLTKYIEISAVTDNELAKTVGVTRSTISRWKAGLVNRPDCDNVLKCAKFLALSAQDLCSKAERLVKQDKKEALSLVPATVLSLKSELHRLQERFRHLQRPKMRETAEHLEKTAAELAESLSAMPEDLDLKVATLLLKVQVLELQAKELYSDTKGYQLRAKALHFRAEAFKLKPININKLLKSIGCPEVEDEVKDEEKNEGKEDREIISKYERLVPFTTRPIFHPAQFFGRYEVLKKIFAHWTHIPLQHVAMIGPKLSGKTSLLNYLQSIHDYDEQRLRNGQRQNWLKQRCDWVLVDFENPQIQNPTDLLGEILEKLHFQIPDKHDLGDFIKVFEDNVHHPTVILMDNLEEGIQSPNFDRTFWRNTMRYLGSHCSQLGFCVTSRQPIEKLVELAEKEDKSSPFFNIFKAIKLGPLTEEEARELLSYYALSLSTQHEASQLNNTSSPLSQEEMAWILEQSQFWPALLQTLCEIRYDTEKGEDWQQIGRKATTSFFAVRD
jgi:transcriptional regulator with XRE-family HTH domain